MYRRILLLSVVIVMLSGTAHAQIDMVNSKWGVNLSDLAIFAPCYMAPMTPPCHCTDYNDDGQVNLSDLAFFAAHYQHECP